MNWIRRSRRIPIDATAHGWLLNYHRFNGDYQSAANRARLADSASGRCSGRHTWICGELLREQGDPAGAIREQERVLEQDAHNVDALAALTRAYIDSARPGKGASDAGPRTQRGSDRTTDCDNSGRCSWRSKGRKPKRLRRWTPGFRHIREIQIFGPASAADFYAVMGDVDKALEWLDRAVRMGDDREDYLRRNPLLTNLRAHPRFQQILDAVAYRRQQRALR